MQQTIARLSLGVFEPAQLEHHVDMPAELPTFDSKVENYFEEQTSCVYFFIEKDFCTCA